MRESLGRKVIQEIGAEMIQARAKAPRHDRPHPQPGMTAAASGY